MDKETKITPCPLCGEYPTLEPWHGGEEFKHMVHCENPECERVSVTGETLAEAIDSWCDIFEESSRVHRAYTINGA